MWRNFINTIHIIYFLLGNSPASEFYMPTFQNTLFHLQRQVGVKNFFTPTCLWRWDRQSVAKRRHIKFRCQRITQKKAYNIQNMAKVWNQEQYILIKKLDCSKTWRVTASCYLVQMSGGGMNWYGLPLELRVPQLHPFGGVQPRKNDLSTHQTTVVGTALHQKLFRTVHFTEVPIVSSPQEFS